MVSIDLTPIKLHQFQKGLHLTSSGGIHRTLANPGGHPKEPRIRAIKAEPSFVSSCSRLLSFQRAFILTPKGSTEINFTSYQ